MEYIGGVGGRGFLPNTVTKPWWNLSPCWQRDIDGLSEF